MGGWAAKLVARQLATAALRVRIQTSLKNHQWATYAKEWPRNSSPPKNIQKKILKDVMFIYGNKQPSTCWRKYWRVHLTASTHERIWETYLRWSLTSVSIPFLFYALFPLCRSRCHLAQFPGCLRRLYRRQVFKEVLRREIQGLKV